MRFGAGWNSAQKTVSLAAMIWASTVPGVAVAAAAADEDTERNYAPSDIVVTGQHEGYSVEDGSTALKTPTALIDTPQAVTVVTRDQLDDQNVRQLGEALRYVAGISMESGEGNRDEVFIRGQESTADFYLNGLRDDAQYYRSLYNVERVEVLKGSNALTFGRGGGGGIINRVSKVAHPRDGFTRGAAQVDSFGAFSLSGDVNAPLGGDAAARLNGTYEEFDSHRDAYEGRFFGIAPTVTAGLGEDTRLVLAYSYEDDRRLADRGIPSLSGRPLPGYDRTLFGDPDFNDSRTKTHIARARIDHDLSDSLSANFSAQYAHYDKSYANIVPGATNGSTVALSGYASTAARENWIAQGNLVWQGDTGPIGHTLLAGFEAVRQTSAGDRANALFATATGTASSVPVALARRLSLPAFSLTAPIRDTRSRLTSLSGYVQDQVDIGDWLQLIAGVRFESFDLKTADLLSGDRRARKDEKWSPRFGVVVKPQDNLSFYASYTQSFLPQAGDQFSLLNADTASLEPERFENIEAGVKWAPRPDLLLTAAAFRLERSNSRAPDPAGSGLSVLTGKTRVQGFEAQLSGNLAENWHVNLGYTYLDGKVLSTTSGAPAGRRLEQVPKHHVAAWMRYDLTDRFGLGAGVIHSSRQYASLSNAVVLPAYTRVDAAAYFDVTDRVAVQLNVENLFDERYYPSAHGDNNIQPAKPLSASVGVRFDF